MAHRTAPAFPLNVHLMMTHPQAYAGRFIDAGASTVLITSSILRHCGDAGRDPVARGAVRAYGQPGTPAEALFPFLREVDECRDDRGTCVCASVIAGQCCLNDAIRREADRWGAKNSVDGGRGINDENAAACAAIGANAFLSREIRLSAAPDGRCVAPCGRRAGRWTRLERLKGAPGTKTGQTVRQI